MSGRKDCFANLTREQRSAMLHQMRENYNIAEEGRRLGIMTADCERIARESMGNILELLERELDGANGEIRRLASEQNRRLREQARNFNRDIEELRRQREADRKELSDALDSLRENIEAKDRNHRDIAEYWIAQTEAYFADIELYRHELFTPNQLSQLRTQLNQVQADIQNEAFQAAIAAARNVFNQAVDLKERVVSAEIEWAHYHSDFQHLFADVRSHLYHFQNLQYEIGEDTVNADIDYWSHGNLSTLSSEIDEITERTCLIYELSTAELIELIARLRDIDSRMTQTAADAKEEMVCSQVRAELADSIANTLQLSGWEFVGYTYEGSEMNAALHIKLRDNLGNEIVTVITPQRDKENNLGNNMEFNFFSDLNNDENTRNIWVAAIIEQLRRAGLDVSKPQTKPGYENRSSDNQAIRDLEATARKNER